MLQVVYSPAWFSGVDILIDAVSVFVLVLVSLAALRYYSLSGKRNHLLLAGGFGVVALGFLAKVFRNFVFYFSDSAAFVSFSQLESSAMFVTFMVLLSRVLTVFGLYLLYAIYYKHSASSSALIVFLLVTSMLLSRGAYFVFHLTSLFLLSFLAVHYVRAYRERGGVRRQFLAGGFSLIALSQLFFVFVGLNGWFYVAGEATQLLGYASLLFTFASVVAHGKKVAA